MSLKCAYHPNRDASEKCEKCGKVICLECKMVFHETHSDGTGDSSYAYSRRYEYCPICFYDRKIKSFGPQTMIAVIIFNIIVIIGFGITDFFTGTYFFIIPLFILIPIDIFVFLYSPRKMKEFKHKKAEFLDNLAITEALKVERSKELFCSECGNKLESDVSVCSYCGTVIKGNMNRS